MSYNFNDIEAKWQAYWHKNQTFKAANHSDKEKFYVLDMFPYPSGAGLHVGHPLGYIASDIYARFKRHQNYNVLHPQGYDSFGLPAEQYAIQTGQHPAITTKTNIKRYREQLDKIGFSFDWSREVRTSDPDYYKWTQWIFIQLFESWYDYKEDKARDIAELKEIFTSKGNTSVNAACDTDVSEFSAEEWKSFSTQKQQEILLKYRLTYLAETEVNWCPQLGTVLANDEIVNGVSERGGYPVVRKKMKQWSMRISAYAERLLQGLESLDWTDSLKESQRNWIGKSVGAIVEFQVLSSDRSKTASHPQPFPEGRESAQEKEYYRRLTGNPKIAGELLKRAKEMRKNPTDAEKKMWDSLRAKKLGVKFRQQHPIDNYIVDFVCLDKKLIIEVDGEIHQFQKEKDEERQLILEQKLGYKTLRFTNDEVKNFHSKVIDEIKAKLEVLPSGEDLGGDASSTASSKKNNDNNLKENASFTNSIQNSNHKFEVFTTRPDTIYGVTFMTLAPEHELVDHITTKEQKEAVQAYKEKTAKRSERERMADVKSITGVFTGAYAEHPFTKEAIPIWIGDYVLASYGTGAVMAVPCGDQRDHDFAKHFEGKPGMPPIKNIFKDVDVSEAAYSGKENTVITNSDFLSDLPYKKALKRAIFELEKTGQGKGKTNYRLRDAVFSRQRYWGEPFPVYYVDGLPQMIAEEHLPLELPEVEKYLPTEEGEPPLGRADVWAWDAKNKKVVKNHLIDHTTVFPLELNTMPGWAGSSWYFFRYMEKEKRQDVFASAEALNYWKNVDLYIGGSEHATGHLLYARFWTKFLNDRNLVPVQEPFKKLINQGMILGESAFVYRLEGENKFVSANKIKDLKVQPIHADVVLVNASNELDIEAFKNWRPEFKEAEFITEEDGKYIVGREVEKMSKSKYNVVNPDDICEEYGADTLRMYEMFLGPLEQSKPWSTAGLSGVHNFLKKLWKLYHNGDEFQVSEEAASKESLKTLHKTIKKVTDDIEEFSFNTSVSTFMICVNELSSQKCNNREVLEPLAVLIAPYAPHIAEELWQKLRNKSSVAFAAYPKFEEKHVKESAKTYPISFNGKMRFTLDLALNLSKEEIEKIVMEDERTQKQLNGREPKKVIIVPGKIVNIVG
ncbi:leucine--tRNA ligase [Haloflavibacter putidus]|uniref:Leucine--tRNA ligase n=1 Tax=Haloflavibacter putidus TaxID=2576776 RepID=A0A507ZS65_9FLAO|nr:leucine--tRNA ligase [Haloflavibacter putidus]TQD38558.1 leucine--tRNA ligase [Haloflavibacter putidus]